MSWHDWVGWMSSALLIVGVIGVGRLWRPSFLFTIAGETGWAAVGIALNRWDLAIVCMVFAFISAANWVQWRGR